VNIQARQPLQIHYYATPNNLGSQWTTEYIYIRVIPTDNPSTCPLHLYWAHTVAKCSEPVYIFSGVQIKITHYTTSVRHSAVNIPQPWLTLLVTPLKEPESFFQSSSLSAVWTNTHE